MPRAISEYNRIRTTILLHKIETKKSQKVPGRQDVRKTPYLFSKILIFWGLPWHRKVFI